MSKRLSQLDKAIANLEGEIAILQMAVAKLKAQQTQTRTKAQARQACAITNMRPPQVAK